MYSRRCPICRQPLSTVSPGRVCDSAGCRIAYRRHLEQGGRTCLVCGCPLATASHPDLQSGTDRAAEIPRSSRLNSPTCGNPDCEVGYLRQKELPKEHRCRICSTPLPAWRLSTGVCDDRECQAIHAGQRLAARALAEEERLERIRRAGEARRMHEAAKESIQHPESFPVIVVPHQQVPLAPKDPQRVAKIRVWLESLVQWAFTHEPDSSEIPRRSGYSTQKGDLPSPYQPDEIAAEADTLEARLFSNGCRLCRGACCRTGAEHAYLNILQIRQFIAEHPAFTEPEIIDAYLAYVPSMSIENSCVFHGEFGCTLPRQMRSDMCNRWICGGLNKLRNQLADGAAPQFYIVSAQESPADEQIVAAEFVQ